MFEEATLARLRALRDRLRTAPGVESVMSILDVPLLDNVEDVSLAAVADNLRTLDDPDTDRARARAELLESPVFSETDRQRRRAHRRAPPHDAGRRGVPRTARRSATGC